MFLPLIDKTSCIIVGSFALNIRPWNDIDIITSLDNINQSELDSFHQKDGWIASGIKNGIKYEFLLTDNDESLKNLLFSYDKFELRDLEICYILKRGHIHIAGRNQENWEKHMNDMNILKKILQISGNFETLYDEHIKNHKKSTDLRIKQKTPKLKGVTLDKFFDDYVQKTYVHDSIHAAIAYNEGIPMFTKMQKGDGTVECYKALWDTFTYEEQCQCVSEECAVIALERKIIPFEQGSVQKPTHPFIAYKWALYRVCTTLCSGWFRDFAIDNYLEILNMYKSMDYVNKFKQNIEKYEKVS